MEKSATVKLDQLFSACDLDGSGYIDQSELALVCSELSKEDLKEVFMELDKDGDGRISVEEFAKGFAEISEAMQERTREKRREKLKSMSSDERLDGGVPCNILDEGLMAISW